ncbi:MULTISPECIES: Rid family hydrolase [unclassified Helicobacter]|uniref:Rid family hydrolase n=1 Tax=unclassified Helicobacter TaxID=2593540 RepID=UPI0009ECE5FB|nr:MULTISPECIES: Rid family hydrolase [unclassified Helicobacter]
MPIKYLKNTAILLAFVFIFLGCGNQSENQQGNTKNQGVNMQNPPVQYITLSGKIGEMQNHHGYNGAVIINDNIIKISGQGGWNREFDFPHEKLEDEINQAFENVAFVLESAGSDWSRVYSVTTYFTGKITEEINQTMAKQFKSRCKNLPIWTSVQVAGLGDARMRVEVVVEAYK